ncbi:MAG: L-threonylcarbamoyladenylate synthase [Oscillospiraceae bacterium]|nr:L-threonylcarbamoyladenylate synthase [Oscillospiraceae bacterium]
MKSIISTNLDKAVELLQACEIVALPTETVYGLAGNALSKDAISKIYVAKNRPQDNPLIVHVSDIEMARKLGLKVHPLAEQLAHEFWPGPLTMVLQKSDDCKLPPEISCGLESVGVRVPNSSVMLEIIKTSNLPLAAPSANLSGVPSPTTAAHVYVDLHDKIPLIIDGGACQIGIESTVVMFENDNHVNNKSENTIIILRPGAVTPEMLSAFGEVVLSDNESPLSPGTRYKHYSPKAKVIAVEGKVTGLGEHIIETPDSQTLFAKLRTLDELGAKTIYIQLPKSDGIGLALRNRIIRAAEFEVLKL